MHFLVAKVGGSLFDLPDLNSRLQQWIARQGDLPIVFVPGGGPLVDAIRRLDAVHHLGDERSHWLALQAMTINAKFLVGLFRKSQIVEIKAEAIAAWRKGHVAVLDAYPFCQIDDSGPDRLPHSWAITSDSIALRVAVAWNAIGCVLLKSAPPPGPPENWAAEGYADAGLFQIMKHSGVRLWVENLSVN